MKTYKYAKVHPQYHVEMYSTDPQVINWILSELKKIIPTFSFTRKSTTDFSGKAFEFRIDQLQNKDYIVGMWIIQQLCQNGWEPFGVTGNGDDEIIHLRLEINE